MFKQILYKFATPTGVLTSLFIVVVILFFFNDNFRNKNSEWFFDGISKLTGKTSVSNNISIHGSVEASVSKPFKDATQACWYYHANYENSHPYTILWNKPEEENDYPKIRVIAESAYWSAEKCIKEDKEVKLVGIEHTKHSIEAKFEKEGEFIRIASSDAYYRSNLSFNEEGRIMERKTLQSDFEYSSNRRLCDVIGGIKRKDKSVIQCNEIIKIEPMKFHELKKKNNPFNILIVSSDFNPTNNSLYEEAIIRYIKEREKIHGDLSQHGCGAISIEPELAEDSGDFARTSLVFLCLKKSDQQSHVRLMHRINEEKF